MRYFLTNLTIQTLCDSEWKVSSPVSSGVLLTQWKLIRLLGPELPPGPQAWGGGVSQGVRLMEPKLKTNLWGGFGWMWICQAADGYTHWPAETTAQSKESSVVSVSITNGPGWNRQLDRRRGSRSCPLVFIPNTVYSKLALLDFASKIDGVLPQGSLFASAWLCYSVKALGKAIK